MHGMQLMTCHECMHLSTHTMSNDAQAQLHAVKYSDSDRRVPWKMPQGFRLSTFLAKKAKNSTMHMAVFPRGKSLSGNKSSLLAHFGLLTFHTVGHVTAHFQGHRLLHDLLLLETGQLSSSDLSRQSDTPLHRSPLKSVHRRSSQGNPDEQPVKGV